MLRVTVDRVEVVELAGASVRAEAPVSVLGIGAAWSGLDTRRRVVFLAGLAAGSAVVLREVVVVVLEAAAAAAVA